jgi:hypothetical protein
MAQHARGFLLVGMALGGHSGHGILARAPDMESRTGVDVLERRTHRMYRCCIIYISMRLHLIKSEKHSICFLFLFSHCSKETR